MSNVAGTPAEQVLERFRYGGCYAMAYALAEALGWAIECLSVQWSELPNFPHAWVVDEAGRAFDAFGFTTREAIYEEFIAGSSRLADKDALVRVEQFATPAEFFARILEGYGHRESIPAYVAYFQKEVTTATGLINDVLLLAMPVHVPGPNYAVSERAAPSHARG